jgi:hypothetical protein
MLHKGHGFLICPRDVSGVAIWRHYEIVSYGDSHLKQSITTIIIPVFKPLARIAIFLNSNLKCTSMFFPVANFELKYVTISLLYCNHKMNPNDA